MAGGLTTRSLLTGHKAIHDYGRLLSGSKWNCEELLAKYRFAFYRLSGLLFPPFQPYFLPI